MLKTAFWQRAAHSLPKSVRSRYAAKFERAERIDFLIGALTDAFRRAFAPRLLHR